MAPEAAVRIAGVGVGVEVDHRDAAEAVMFGDARGGGVGDRVVAAEHDGHRAGSGDALAGVHQPLQPGLAVELRHVDVADIDDAELVQRIDTQREVRPVAGVRQIVGAADRAGTEARARPPGRARVERGPDDHGLRVGPALGLAKFGARDAEEGVRGTVLGQRSGQAVSLRVGVGTSGAVVWHGCAPLNASNGTGGGRA